MRLLLVLAPLLFIATAHAQAGSPITLQVQPAQHDPHDHAKDHPPIVIYDEQPEYSKEARAKNIHGNVLVAMTVNEKGKPVDVHVVRGIGYGLDEKAVESVKHYKFRPASKDGVPVAFPLKVEVNFQLF